MLWSQSFLYPLNNLYSIDNQKQHGDHIQIHQRQFIHSIWRANWNKQATIGIISFCLVFVFLFFIFLYTFRSIDFLSITLYIYFFTAVLFQITILFPMCTFFCLPKYIKRIPFKQLFLFFSNSYHSFTDSFILFVKPICISLSLSLYL